MIKEENEDLDFFYLDANRKEKGRIQKKSDKKDNIKKKTKKKKQLNNKDDKFSFDDEFVIGMKQKELIPKKGQANKKNKKQNKQEKTKKKQIKKNILTPEQQEKIKIRNKRIIRSVKILSLLILLTLAIVLFLLSPLFNIKQIKVIGNEKLTQEQIIALSGIVIEENTFKINRYKTISSINQNPYIEKVKILRKLPDVIEIQVEERKTTYMLEFANAYVYINNQGYMLEISSEKLDVPTIIQFSTPLENIKEGNRLEVEDLQKLETVLKIMKTIRNQEIEEKVTKIDIKDDNNFTLYFEKEGKIVYLGDASNINTRILHMKRILKDEKENNGEAFINGDLNTEYVFFRKKVN